MDASNGRSNLNPVQKLNEFVSKNIQTSSTSSTLAPQISDTILNDIPDDVSPVRIETTSVFDNIWFAGGLAAITLVGGGFFLYYLSRWYERRRPDSDRMSVRMSHVYARSQSESEDELSPSEIQALLEREEVYAEVVHPEVIHAEVHAEAHAEVVHAEVHAEVVHAEIHTEVVHAEVHAEVHEKSPAHQGENLSSSTDAKQSIEEERKKLAEEERRKLETPSPSSSSMQLLSTSVPQDPAVPSPSQPPPSPSTPSRSDE